MSSNSNWLPELITFNGNWSEYEDKLYAIFSQHFLNSNPYFMGKKVIPRRNPMYNGKYESYFHITCGHTKETDERSPDLRRCERIEWPRAFIENSNCICKQNCSDFIIWKKRYKNKYRYSLLLKSEKYIVILEERANYFNLISAYPLTYSHAMHDQLEYYERAKKAENAIIR